MIPPANFGSWSQAESVFIETNPKVESISIVAKLEGCKLKIDFNLIRFRFHTESKKLGC
jgi:hypothetical protein